MKFFSWRRRMCCHITTPSPKNTREPFISSSKSLYGLGNLSHRNICNVERHGNHYVVSALNSRCWVHVEWNSSQTERKQSFSNRFYDSFFAWRSTFPVFISQVGLYSRVNCSWYELAASFWTFNWLVAVWCKERNTTETVETRGRSSVRAQ
jgi:hypothetical protein